MSDKCEKCGGRVALGRFSVEAIEPDLEPFEDGVQEDIPEIETHITVWGWVCVDCGKPYDLWYRHESGYGESEDENLHAFRQKMERLRRQLAHAREENERVRLEL